MEGGREYFLTHQFQHISRMLKRTVSFRWFFRVPTTYVLVEGGREGGRDGWMDGRPDRRMDVQTDGWMNGPILIVSFDKHQETKNKAY